MYMGICFDPKLGSSSGLDTGTGNIWKRKA